MMPALLKQKTKKQKRNLKFFSGDCFSRRPVPLWIGFLCRLTLKRISRLVLPCLSSHFLLLFSSPAFGHYVHVSPGTLVGVFGVLLFVSSP